MLKNLIREGVFTLVQHSLAAGSSDPSSTVLDMAEYDSACLIGTCSTAAGGATSSMKVQTAASSSGSWADLVGAVATSTGGSQHKLLIVDVCNPPKRFLKSVLTRAGANSSWGGTTAIRYGRRNLPTTQTGLAATEVLAVCPSTV